MDAQNRTLDLTAVILSASPSSAIAAASSFLRRHSSDQPRAFFSTAFPALIRRIFGFDDPSNPSWLSLATDDPALASDLFKLLSPSGPLFSSIAAVDRHSLIKYVFPIERLPEWMRFALQNDRYASVLSDLCPLFKSRVREDKIQGCYQLQLNVFEYYVFWFAYYPVCRGNSEIPDPADEKKTRRFLLENWTSSLPGLSASSRRSGRKTEGKLYLQLLYAYLRAFVPKCGIGSYQPYRSSLLHYSSSYDVSAFMQAEFFVHALIHFWLLDNDFSPLPFNLCRSFGISFPLLAVLGEIPPTAGLGEVLNLMVKYLNCSSVAPLEENEKILPGGSPAHGWNDPGSVAVGNSTNMISSCESYVGTWNMALQRPLYRFILRTFLFCPIGTSVKNAAQVCSLWMTFMTPWRTSSEEFVEFEAPEVQKLENSKKANIQSQGGSSEEALYTPSWQFYVLSNYLFYTSLVVHFLGFAHKFLHANAASVIELVSKVLDILTSSKEFVSLLRKVDEAYHSKSSGPSSFSDSFYKYVPSIREQMQDWEDGLCETDADGSFFHENWSYDFKLFTDGEDGAQNLLQCPKVRFLIVSEEAHFLPGRGEAFIPKHPGVGKRVWADVKYKGDWMRRPISENEVAWLARLLIKLSDWLNEALGLDQAEQSDSVAGPAYMEINPTIPIKGPKEAVHLVAAFVVSSFVSFVQTVLRFMRAHRMRINLRMFASKKLVMVLFVFVVGSVLMKGK
ncbi:hypothetical protein J5N97_018575 [Dioscorea zingiberensis]|uniref:Sphingomyelin phosphodiesterase 4 n=1 Tax=Dioscorea zingiberensis TaxID=325984 RepID=A0A9D5CCI9_9LILI|nr:hypothetical protein J5N97_018575 [Dioscorea zingiberensis]